MLSFLSSPNPPASVYGDKKAGASNDALLTRHPRQPARVDRKSRIITKASGKAFIPLPNTIPHKESKELLKQLDAQSTAQAIPLASLPHSAGLKTLILSASQLLIEMDKLSRQPASEDGKTYFYRPASLVVYHDRLGRSPLIVPNGRVTEMERKPMHSHVFRFIARVAQEGAEKKPVFSPEFGINLLAQSVAGMFELLHGNPLDALTLTAHHVENTLKGVNSVTFSATEMERIQKAAKLYGYEDDMPAYLSKLFDFVQDTNNRLMTAPTPKEDEFLRLGISYRDKKRAPFQDVVEDINALFPGCDIYSALPAIEKNRDKLEYLFFNA